MSTADLIDNGLRIFPCRGKIPLTRRGFHDASNDRRIIDEWAWRWPGCNWGAALGSGIFVLDVDAHHDGYTTLAALEADHGALPATRTTGTARGGEHRWFRADLPVRQTAGLLGPGLDTRAPGQGYVLVPPSAGYSWKHATEVATPPRWLSDLLAPPKPKPRRAVLLRDKGCSSYVKAALRAEVDQVRTSQPGTRNHTLFTAALALGSLVGAGLLDQYTAADALLGATSLPDTEAKSTIRSGLERGADHPRQVAR